MAKKKAKQLLASSQPAAEGTDDAMLDAARVLEGLRATRDASVNTSVLQELQTALRGSHGTHNLVQLVHASPLLSELVAVWDAQLKARNQQVMVALLVAVAGVLHAARIAMNVSYTQQHEQTGLDDGHGKATAHSNRRKRDGGLETVPPTTGTTAGTTLSASDRDAIMKAAEGLIHDVISTKMRSVYFSLSSEVHQLQNAALSLLGAIARYSTAASRQLLTALDTQLTALTTLAKPPRRQGSGGTTLSDSQYWKQWRAYNPLSRPSRALLMDLVLSLLACGDQVLVSCKLLGGGTAGGGGGPSRTSLLSVLLGHMASDPPAKALQLLQWTAKYVMGGDSLITPATRAGLWSDFTLSQLGDLAAVAEEVAGVTPPEGFDVGDSQAFNQLSVEAAKALAAQAAAEALLVIITDTSQGLVNPSGLLDIPLQSTTTPSQDHARGPPEGMKRVLRLLAKLKPASHTLHAAVLRGVADRQPAIAAEFLSTVQWPTEPAASSMWVAHVTILTSLLSSISRAAPSTLLASLQNAASTLNQLSVMTASCSDAVSEHHQDITHITPPLPPSMDSAVVRAALRRCFPAALSKAVLTKALTHSQSLVRYVALKALSACLANFRPIILAVSEAAGIASQLAASTTSAQGSGQRNQSNGDALVNPSLNTLGVDVLVQEQQASDSDSQISHLTLVANAWSSFLRSLRSSVRARLPELQLLLQLSAGSDSHASNNSKAGRPAAVIHAEATDDLMRSSLDTETQQERSDQAKDQIDAEELKALERQVFGTHQPNKDEQQQQTSETPSEKAHNEAVASKALSTLAMVVELFPGWTLNSHLDPFKLLPSETAVSTAEQKPAGHTSAGVLSMSDMWQSSWLALLQAMQTAQHQSGISTVASTPQSGASQLMPLMRMYMHAADPAVRLAAGHCLSHQLQSTGIFTSQEEQDVLTRLNSLVPEKRPLSQSLQSGAVSSLVLQRGSEALVWIAQLPKIPLSVTGGTAGSNTAASSLSATATFLSDAIVTVSRRPHEAYELLHNSLTAGQTRLSQYIGSGLTTSNGISAADKQSPTGSVDISATQHGISPLVPVVIRSCLRACKPTSKTASANKAVICCYVSGVLNSLTLLQPQPGALLAVLLHLIITEWGQEHQANAPKAVIHVPQECHTLVSVTAQLWRKVSADSCTPQQHSMADNIAGLLLQVSPAEHPADNHRTRALQSARNAAPAVLQKATDAACMVLQAQADIWQSLATSSSRDAVAHAQKIATSLLAVRLAANQGGLEPVATQQQPEQHTKKKAKKQWKEALQDRQSLAVNQGKAHPAILQLLIELLVQPLHAHGLQLRDVLPDQDQQAVQAQNVLNDSATAWCECMEKLLRGSVTSNSNASIQQQPLEKSSLDWCTIFQLMTRDMTQALSGGKHNTSESITSMHGLASRMLSTMHPCAALLAMRAAGAMLNIQHLELHATITPSIQPANPVSAQSLAKSCSSSCSRLLNLQAAVHLFETVSAAGINASNMSTYTGVLSKLAAACLDAHVSLQGCRTCSPQSHGNACSGCQHAKAVLLRVVRCWLGQILNSIDKSVATLVDQLQQNGKPNKKKHSKGRKDTDAPEATTNETDNGQAALLGTLSSLADVAGVYPRGPLYDTALSLLRITSKHCQGDSTDVMNNIAVSALRLAISAMQHKQKTVRMSDNLTMPLAPAMTNTELVIAAQATMVMLIQATCSQKDMLEKMPEVLRLRDALLAVIIAGLHSTDKGNNSISHNNAMRVKRHADNSQDSPLAAHPVDGLHIEPLLIAFCIVLPTKASSLLLALLVRRSTSLMPGMMSAMCAVLQKQSQQQDNTASTTPGSKMPKTSQSEPSTILQAVEKLHTTCTPVLGTVLSHKQRLALLLPVVSACLPYAASSKQASMTDLDADRQDKQDQQQLRGSTVIQLAQIYKDPLLAYLRRKRRKANTTEHASTGKGGTPAYTASVSDWSEQAVAAALHADGLPVALACNDLLPLTDDEGLDKLLEALIPAGSWQCSEWRHLPEAGPGCQAAAATALIARLLDNKDLEYKRRDHGLKQVAKLLQAVCATLAACYENTENTTCTKPTSHFQGLQPSGKSNFTRSVAVTIETDLADVMNGPLGDCIASLTIADRGGSSFAAMVQSAGGLLAATLQHRGQDPASVKTARRLLAALMPDPNEGDESDAENDGAVDEDGADTAQGLQQADNDDGDEIPAEDDMDGHNHDQDYNSMTEDEDENEHSNDDGINEINDDVSQEGMPDFASDSESSQHSLQQEVESDEEDGSLHDDPGQELNKGNGDQDLDDEGMVDDPDIAPESTSEEENSDVEEQPDNGGEDEAMNVDEPMQALQDVLQQPAIPDMPTIINPQACALLGHVLAAVTSHPSFLQCITQPAEQAPLHPAVMNLPIPCPTLTPYAALLAADTYHPTDITSQTTATQSAAADSLSSESHSSTSLHVPQATQNVGSLRFEMLMLLETLVGLLCTYHGTNNQHNGSQNSMDDSSDSDDDNSSSDMNEGPAAAVYKDDKQPPAQLLWPSSGSEAAHLRRLLHLLLPTYCASLSEEDSVRVRILMQLDGLIAAYETGNPSIDVMTLKLSGPLARLGYLWGPAAAAALLNVSSSASSEQSVHNTIETHKEHSTSIELQTQQVAQLITDHKDNLLDGRRIAFSCVLFPDSRTAMGEEDTTVFATTMAGNTESSSTQSKSYQHQTLTYSAMDPAWLLPFAVLALRGGELPVPFFTRSRLIAVCLRGLASSDVPLRALAYEALGLFVSRLETVASLQQQDTTTAGQDAQKQGPRHPDDFKEKTHVLAVLRQVRNGVTQPLQKLPACLALWAAESVCLLTEPLAALQPAVAAVRKSLLNSESLQTHQLPPALPRALASGSPSARSEQLWALSLLLGGLCASDDALLYRKRFVPQLLMTLTQSSCIADNVLPSNSISHHTDTSTATQGAGTSSSSSNASDLALAVIARGCMRVPSLARHLVLHAGVIPWLIGIALSNLTTTIENQLRNIHSTPSNSSSSSAHKAITAIRTLCHLVKCRVGCPGVSNVTKHRHQGAPLSAASQAYINAATQLMNAYASSISSNLGHTHRGALHSHEQLGREIGRLADVVVEVEQHDASCQLSAQASASLGDGPYASRDCWCGGLRYALTRL